MEALLNADFTEKPPPTILTVEDDEGLLLLIQRRLKRVGFHALGVSKGA